MLAQRRPNLSALCHTRGRLVTRCRSSGVIVEDVRVQVISAARPEWIYPFTGLQPAQFRHLVRLVAPRGGDLPLTHAAPRSPRSPTGVPLR